MKIKGVQDYVKNEGELREHLKDVIMKKYQQYGFEPVESAILTSMDVLTSKYGGGNEIVKEIYRVKEQGDRDLGLRFDLTVPLMKILNQYKQLGKPYKRCEIGKVFRNGDVKRGRLREFTQCDADIVGTEDVSAEVEVVVMVLNVFHELGLEDVIFYYNNRQVLEGIILENGIESDKVEDVILTVDKLEKMDRNTVLQELEKKGVDTKTGDKLIDDLTQLSEDELRAKYTSDKVQNGFEQVSEFQKLLSALGKLEQCKFSASLARGLNFYQGMIYEAFMTNSKIKSSIAAGGRYGIIGDVEESAVGISIGLDVLKEVVQEQEVSDDKRRGYYIIPVGEHKADAFKLAESLRSQEELVELEMVGRSIGKSFKAADSNNYKYAVVVGENEVDQGYYTCKDMDSGDETHQSFDF